MKTLKHKFVESIPEELELGVLYVSIEYCTAIHKCVCGCDNEVVTPLSPTDWNFTFNGKTISLHPSIGNWNFDCQSHYWIENSKIIFARKWDKVEIEAGRKADEMLKKDYFKKKEKKFFK
jgi:hypothetical protein